jgi:hypothetical protein
MNNRRDQHELNRSGAFVIWLEKWGGCQQNEMTRPTDLLLSSDPFPPSQSFCPIVPTKIRRSACDRALVWYSICQLLADPPSLMTSALSVMHVNVPVPQLAVHVPWNGIPVIGLQKTVSQISVNRKQLAVEPARACRGRNEWNNKYEKLLQNFYDLHHWWSKQRR